MNMRETKRATSDAELDKAEEKLRIKFPLSYRSWLLQHNGGIPERRQFKFKNQQGVYSDSLINRFFAVYDGKFSNFFVNFFTFRGENSPPGHQTPNRLPGQLVPIADDPFGNLICLDFSVGNQGNVYFWDHEAESKACDDQGIPTYANCRLIANGFEEFIEGLY